MVSKVFHHLGKVYNLLNNLLRGLLWQLGLREKIGQNVSGSVSSTTIKLLGRYCVSYLRDLISGSVHLKADGAFKPFYLLSPYFLYPYSLLSVIPQCPLEVV